MGNIILARCGTTDFDDQGRIVGTLDIPVNMRGRAELSEMADEFRDQSIDTIYSAAGESARESARELGEQLGVRVRILDDLRNVDLGLWQGLPVAEVRRKHRKVFKQWKESPTAVCPPQGETVDEVLERVRKALKPVIKRAQNAVVVLVVSDPLRQVIRSHLKQTDLEDIFVNGNGSNWETIEVASA